MTTFTLIETLPPSETGDFLRLLEEEVAPRLTRQEGGYARGRAFAWLGWEPTFYDPPVAVERPRGALWERLERLVPGIEAAECWRNGRDSSPGIHPHRDAPYADDRAWVLNLGRTSFRIWMPGDTTPDPVLQKKKVSPKLTEYEAELAGGELLTFDCKTLHGSRTNAPVRWGIGLWRFKPAWKRRATFRRA